MAPIRIAGAHNPVNQVEFEVELPEEEILSFTVPKAQYIAKPLMEKYEKWYSEWEKQATSPDPAEREKLRDYDPTLKMFELVLPRDIYKKVASLSRGELMDLDREWTTRSGIKVGESSASNAS
ncbi:hypothetical protein [Nocardia sp. NPDC004260]